MQFATPEAVTEALAGEGYLADRALSTAAFLAATLEQPLLLEGEAGVGKTEVARALAGSSATRGSTSTTRSTTGTTSASCSRSGRPRRAPRPGSCSGQSSCSAGRCSRRSSTTDRRCC